MHHHKRTCKRIFSKIMFVDLTCVHQNRAHKIICKKIASCTNLQLPIVILNKTIISDMRHRKMYMHINFQQNRVSIDQSKPCVQIYLQKNCKLHAFTTTNSNFEKVDYFRHASS